MIQRAETIEQLTAAAHLAAELWPSQSTEEFLTEFEESREMGLFLSVDREEAVGFAQCQLRRDYVEGTEHSPVGYLEGIYVQPNFRGRGLARELLEACQAWAARRGCSEFASDCELENEDSLRFHLHCGFREANRIICFTKKLNR